MNTNTTKNIRSGQYVIPKSDLLIRDEPAPSEGDISPYADPSLWLAEGSRFPSATMLECYYNDLYKYFLATLSAFDQTPSTTAVHEVKLQELLAELVKVKSLLEVQSE